MAIDSIENGYGDTILSATRPSAWPRGWIAGNRPGIGATSSPVPSGKVKGGLTVLVNGIRAFLPGSLVDIRPVRTPRRSKASNGIQGHQAGPQAQQRGGAAAPWWRTPWVKSAALLETLTEGAIVKGVVKNITEYGAFVDLGGIDGLLHITDLAWRRVRHPSEVLAVVERPPRS